MLLSFMGFARCRKHAKERAGWLVSMEVEGGHARVGLSPSSCLSRVDNGAGRCLSYVSGMMRWSKVSS